MDCPKYNFYLSKDAVWSGGRSGLIEREPRVEFALGRGRRRFHRADNFSGHLVQQVSMAILGKVFERE